VRFIPDILVREEKPGNLSMITGETVEVKRGLASIFRLTLREAGDLAYKPSPLRREPLDSCQVAYCQDSVQLRSRQQLYFLTVHAGLLGQLIDSRSETVFEQIGRPVLCAALNDELDFACISDVDQWVSIDDQHVGQLARLNRSKLPVFA